jgi:hypothetical protein
MRKWIVPMILAAFVMGSAIPAIADDDGDLVRALVESASTPQQHTALANYFMGMAADARREAESHRAMAKADPREKPGALARIKEHCGKLAALFEQQAVEYEGLAQMHRELAK